MKKRRAAAWLIGRTISVSNSFNERRRGHSNNQSTEFKRPSLYRQNCSPHVPVCWRIYGSQGSHAPKMPKVVFCFVLHMQCIINLRSKTIKIYQLHAFRGVFMQKKTFAFGTPPQTGLSRRPSGSTFGP